MNTTIKPFLFASEELDTQVEVRGESIYFNGRHVSKESLHDLETAIGHARIRSDINRGEAKRIARMKVKP